MRAIFTTRYGTFYHADCFNIFPYLPSGSVDMVLCDLPYGTTRCKWDTPLPLALLWEQWKRVCKENAAIVLFASQPFATDLIQSNRKMFRYDLVWQKTAPTGFLNAKRMPLRFHELLLVFYRKLPTYNPQRWTAKNPRPHVSKKSQEIRMREVYDEFRDIDYIDTGERMPRSVLTFKRGRNERGSRNATAKPVHLCEYLIKTYTNEGNVVLDNCAGTGATCIASEGLARRWIGIEKEFTFYQEAKERLAVKQEE